MSLVWFTPVEMSLPKETRILMALHAIVKKSFFFYSGFFFFFHFFGVLNHQTKAGFSHFTNCMLTHNHHLWLSHIQFDSFENWWLWFQSAMVIFSLFMRNVEEKWWWEWETIGCECLGFTWYIFFSLFRIHFYVLFHYEGGWRRTSTNNHPNAFQEWLTRSPSLF